MVYYGNFDCWQDVSDSYNLNESLGNKIVLFASYDTPDYEGYSTVIYIEDGKFYMVEASHCSCYGLEDSWAPEEMPCEAIMHIAKKGHNCITEYQAEFLQILDKIVKRFDLLNLSPEEAQVVLKLGL